MEHALGIVAVFALLTTLAMGVVTWRIVREERRRSAARLAALTAEVALRDPAPGPIALTPDPLAAFESEAPQSPEAEDVSERPPDAAAHRPPASGDHEVARQADLFTRSFHTADGWPKRLAAIGVAGAFLAVLVSLVVILSSSRTDAEVPAPDPPIELLTLAHARKEGMIAISGTVRRQTDGVDREDLDVLAMAFDDAGTMVASGRARVGGELSQRGNGVSFVVAIPGEAASRYRISFLVDDRTVPHLDLRGPTTVVGDEGDDATSAAMLASDER